ncbi:MAG TPA: tRNA dihydrouridine synthase DusB [Symbiobacteriaceae bacterium]|nr:tRNA dihydrouridine synthase DusB [Symbiobacteriaceae bacterium]
MPGTLLKPIQLGSLTIERPLALAPMAGVTNWPFRLLCKEKGCGIVVTEFVSDKAILFDSKRTHEMMELLEVERPAGVQIFGADPDTMARAAARVVELEHPDFIDINMGCPAPKVTKGRGGSSLLKEPENAQEIVRQVVRAVAPLPVTVKFRIGWDASTINAVEIARRAEAAGAQMLTVHGRTREQQYGGQADWDVIGQVAHAVSVPVLGNGDIATPQQAAHRLETTGCAGLAIARGAMGNPWVFERTVHYIETGEVLPEPGARERVDTALRHLDLMIEYRGEYLAVREMRKHAAWYLKGLWGAAEARNLINTAETPDGLRQILLEYVERSARHRHAGEEPGPGDDLADEAPDSCDAYRDPTA